MRIPALAAALGFACAASAAFAQDAAPQVPAKPAAARFKQADSNGDGMLSREEAKALPSLSKHFDEIDANHDGQLTADELRAWHAKAREQRKNVAAARFRKIDTDGDGKISLAEAQANAPKLAARFGEIDADKDGYITPEELRAAQLHRQQASSK